MRLHHKFFNNELVDKDGNKYIDLEVKDGVCELNITIQFPLEYSKYRLMLKPFWSKKKSIADRKFPHGCSYCKDRYNCHFIKSNSVNKCEINKENKIRLGIIDRCRTKNVN